MSRRILKTTALLALSASLVACPGDQEERAVRQAQRGGMVVTVEGADMDKPMPLITSSVTDQQIESLIYMSLLSPIWENGRLEYLTADHAADALARSYEFFGPDSASLRYRLRSDVLWSDGTPVTAHDAVWTIQTRGVPAVASPRMDYNRHIREVVAEDDSTLVIHFTHRYPEMFFHTSGNVAPRHVFEGTEPAQLRNHPAVADPARNLVYNGPFRIVAWDRGQRVVLERNPVFEPAPNLDRLVFRVVPEPTTRLIELETANVDVMAPVPFDQVDRVRRSGHVRIEAREKRSYEYIAYNPRTVEAFRDPEVRRALGLALDIEGIIAALQMEEWAVPAGGPYPPIFPDLYDPQGQAPLAHDPEAARRILAERGWQPGPDGILRREGRPLRFTLVTNADNPRRADVAQIAQHQWRQIGVDAQIQLLEFNTFIERLQRRNFEAAVAGWSVGLSPNLEEVWMGDKPFNYVSYENPEVNRLIEQALAQPTAELANPIWREAAARIVQDQPYTWLYYLDQLVGVNDRLQGTRIDTLGTYQRIWEWWVRGGAGAPDAAPTS